VRLQERGELLTALPQHRIGRIRLATQEFKTKLTCKYLGYAFPLGNIVIGSPYRAHTTNPLVTIRRGAKLKEQSYSPQRGHFHCSISERVIEFNHVQKIEVPIIQRRYHRPITFAYSGDDLLGPAHIDLWPVTHSAHPRLFILIEFEPQLLIAAYLPRPTPKTERGPREVCYSIDHTWNGSATGLRSRFPGESEVLCVRLKR
jgi:hypothetical protein